MSREEYNKIKKSIKKNLQEKFIITYVENTNTNYELVCKKLYSTLLNECYNNKSHYNLLDSKITIGEITIVRLNHSIKK